MQKRHTYNMGIIGNGSFMAHISDRGEIKWMCWPRFDSSFIFGNLLDPQKGGTFSILPTHNTTAAKQSYLKNTNILCTDITTESGSFRITDFAPRFSQYNRFYRPLMLVRKIEPLSGSNVIKVNCEPRGDYGRIEPVQQMGSNHIRYAGLEAEVRLTTNIPLNYLLAGKPFVLNAPKYLVLTWGPPLEAPLETVVEDFLRKTRQHWEEWVRNSTLCQFHQESVIRSALALKLHQYDDTGAIIAAGTTSLPEYPGSGRTWDYRYCWLRDAYYTLNAFNNISHFEELEHYSEFIQNIALSEEQRYHPVYNIIGEADLTESECALDGYLGNGPVRIGNQAVSHIQNDSYGQALLSMLPLYVDQRLPEQVTRPDKNLIYHILSRIEKSMQEADAGLWEFRNVRQLHTYTLLFHWAGSLAAERIAECIHDPKMLDQAQLLKNKATLLLKSCFDKKRGIYTQAKNNPNMDASLFQLITMHFVDPASRQAKQQLRQIEKELKISKGLYYRYRHADDFGKPRAAFLVCGFWHVEALACVGEVDQAISEFETLLSCGNHLGLFSEDVDPADLSQWGNFPQTYSHVGLVNAAFRIASKLDKPNFLK